MKPTPPSRTVRAPVVLLYISTLVSLAACATLPMANAAIPLLASPSVTAASPSPTRRPSPTLKIVQTRVPTPTPPPPTPTPWATPLPTQPLSSRGPFLVYIKDEPGGRELVLRDQNAAGATSLLIPESASIGNLGSSISPDGNWLAFCDGRPRPYEGIPVGPYDLSLNLMHLPDGAITRVTRLLSHDYPDNFARQAESLNKTLAEQPDSYEVTAAGLQEWFGSLCIAQWSHDGTRLAFSGEMDGPSWDLYVYSMKSGSIQRMSSGIENVVGVSWSPHDMYLLHWSAFDVCEGGCERWWVAPANGGKVRELHSPGNSGRGWVSDVLYSVYTAANGIGRGYLFNLNVETDTTTSVWPHQFDAFVTDPSTGVVGVAVEAEESIPPGFYFYNPRTEELEKILDGFIEDVEYWGNGEFTFLVTSDEKGNVAVRPDGTYQVIEGNPRWAYVSPDSQWVAFRTAHTRSGVELLAPDGQTIIVSPDTARAVEWAPDSAGFFYFTEGDLFYVPVDNPSPQHVDTGVVDPYDSYPAWVE